MGSKNRNQTTSTTTQQPTAETTADQTTQEQQDQTTGAEEDTGSIAGSELTALESGEPMNDAPNVEVPHAGDESAVQGESDVKEEPTPAPTEAPTPAPTVASSPIATPSTTTQIDGKNVVVVTGDVPTSGMTKAIIDKVSASVTPTGAMILQSIGEYIENMRPKKPITVADGARYQVSLYRALTRAINHLEGDEFKTVYDTILRLFKDHSKGVFEERYAFRFMESVSLAENDRKAFQRLLNLVSTTADPQTRAHGLKFVEFDKSLEFGVTDQGRANLLNYYQK